MSKTRKVPSLIILLLAAASIALMFGVAGCRNTDTQQTGAQNPPAQTDQSQDPAAAADLAPSDATQATGATQQQPAQPTNQQPASQPAQQTYQQPANQPAQQEFRPIDNLLPRRTRTIPRTITTPAMRIPTTASRCFRPNNPRHRSRSIRSRIDRAKAICWTPGYWSYAPQGYYWVPGVWAQPPQVGFLWTPGYWGFIGGRYRYHYGYWGRHIGYYGGINYGNGYIGIGYQGGYWNQEIVSPITGP